MRIWKMPARAKVAKTKTGLSTKAAMIVAETTVIGPVGPLIWGLVPPKIEARIPMAMAP
ncbi:hypothetical protein NB231_07827 [Nitrococcus mobilis Nb-231]|uniref:Uncharacterized protein n=1 Tax=Nitrococcus mobilis Nb-231 TaxID=314278 RepID=A4BTG0_9GAMM|nr:hypothetical protein NB231_07827 [Nitrococcus mobilis Nb-231]